LAGVVGVVVAAVFFAGVAGVAFTVGATLAVVADGVPAA
jgi:hypothetical protein